MDKSVSKIVKKPMAVGILNQHLPAEYGKSNSNLGMDVRARIQGLQVNILEHLGAHDYSRIVCNFTFEFIRACDRGAIQFARMQFHAPGYLNGTTQRTL